MKGVKTFKTIYDKLGNDSVRSAVLKTAEHLGVRKDVIRMDTNNFCNIRCIMCDRVSTDMKKHFMSLHDFKKIIDLFAPSVRMLYLSCACEPLVTPHFTEYLKYAKEKGIPHISFCTNALLLNRSIIDCLIAYEINEIIISFNGFCKEDYERIMEGANFERVCENLRVLKECRKKSRSGFPQVRLNTILLKSNILQYENLLRFVADYDIDIIQFRELMLLENQNNPVEVKRELLSNLTGKEYEEVLDTIKYVEAQLRSLGKEVILPATFLNSGQEMQEDNHSIYKKSNTQKQSCVIPCFSYWIDYEGMVRVCGYDEKGIIGNVLKQDPKELKEHRRQFQRLSLAGECSRELCTMNIDTTRMK